ncbi:hypothetical protein E8E13_009311 [Curvularia kusanoi]|uniref:Cytochrome P450 n=1 Tax=Curvularia kusanoi TaxID=90978 RepID=A0A9P4WEB9_CURKU|nr:hypothetical protein E8E13_009311 [Curvularia kusanoi]
MGPILLIIGAIVISPILTYYITSSLFFRTANSKAANKHPPTIPYLVPELFKEYGTFAPFKVRSALQSYVVLRDPIHISRVLDAPDHLTTLGLKAEVAGKLYGLQVPPVALDEGKERIIFHDFEEDMGLSAATENYISVLSANMHDKMFQYDTWTRIEDLWSFLQLVLLRCTLETLFGPALLKRYPRMVRDYLNFDAVIEGFLHGLKDWTAKDWTAAANDDNRNATEAVGIRAVRGHLEAFPPDSMSRPAEVLSIIHTTNSTLHPQTFWTALETLRKSHLTRNLTSLIRQNFSPITHKYDIPALTEEPLVQSLQTEVHRLRTATCTVRINKTAGFPLDKHWSLRNGDMVTMFSHNLSLDRKAWKKAQPEALGRPLEEFWAERFLVADRKTRSGASNQKCDVGVLGDLITRLTKNDGYPGVKFLDALRMATIAVLFAEFEIQLCDEDEVDAAIPPLGEDAFGTMKPVGKVAVRIRKRRT